MPLSNRGPRLDGAESVSQPPEAALRSPVLVRRLAVGLRRGEHGTAALWSGAHCSDQRHCTLGYGVSYQEFASFTDLCSI